jgi:hypothetical protein
MPPTTRARASVEKPERDVDATPDEAPKLPALPFDVMDRIADLASPIAVLNLQLANKEWAAACKGKLHKYADEPLVELAERSWDEVVELSEKFEWTKEIDYCYAYLKQRLECFAMVTEVSIYMDDVLDGSPEERGRENMLREWDRVKRRAVEDSILKNLAYYMATLPSGDEHAIRAMRSSEFRLKYKRYSWIDVIELIFGFDEIDDTYCDVYVDSKSSRVVWKEFFESNGKIIREHHERENRKKMKELFESEIERMHFRL